MKRIIFIWNCFYQIIEIDIIISSVVSNMHWIDPTHLLEHQAKINFGKIWVVKCFTDYKHEGCSVWYGWKCSKNFWGLSYRKQDSDFRILYFSQTNDCNNWCWFYKGIFTLLIYANYRTGFFKLWMLQTKNFAGGSKAGF